ncbi:hypothetical protein [Mycobacterium sp. 852002-51163_SCH5372311]|uniref:hypothetical protein n=1 Tax=Mycobacterium sp. 852002-51163_SCH5372311 TaxID=1834097 RepID=UPI0018D362EA|nr:hypothetical protein [Mycobacterium sp. 852002-51163_SCH5372311]
MGRHSLPKKRRNPSLRLALALGPAAAFLAAAGDVHAGPNHVVAKPAAVADDAPRSAQIVAASIAPKRNMSSAAPGMDTEGEFTAASRLRIGSRFLPAGVASERGLQVRTILAARAISAAFPEIHEIGGCRPDALPWHPNGLAIDVMIPNPSSAEGIELGDRIVAFVLDNADRFGMQDAIWRGVYYTPGGSQPSRLGHYDHVHVTTTGGGYPTGDEIYLR